MTRILVIDDEPINHQLVAHALIPLAMRIAFCREWQNWYCSGPHPEA